MESWLGPFLFADPKAGTAKVYGEGTDGIRYVAVGDVAEVAIRALTVPSARNATIPFGGPDPLSQREAVRLFERECRKPFAVTDVPEEALEAQWKSARDPFEKTFAALMLGVARGLGADVEVPPRELAPKLTPPRDFIHRSANSEPASQGR